MLQAQRLFLASLLMLVSLAATAADLPIPSAPSLGAKTYILVDQSSGQVLAAKNPDKRIEPASVTKLMTAYITFDEIKQGNLSPDALVTVSKKAWEMKGSQMFLKVGDKVSVEKLLHGLITASGNDAAVALAEHIAGTTSTFVDYMNQYAKQLGMTNSHFMDVNGLPHEDHYMSARDIATLYSAIVRNYPKLYDEYFHEKKFAYNGIQQYNRNTLLWSDERVDGGKTGHTETAGYNLVASAKDNGMRVISVVTGTDSETARKSQCEALISYAFRFYQQAELFKPDAQISKVRVWKGEQSDVPVVAHGAVTVAYPRGKRDKLTTSAELPGQLTAPVKKGERLGTLAVKYNDKTLKEVPLYAGETVPTGGYIRQAIDEVLMMFQ
ncbi:D-alanyl-D-alanine carboxypeptidase family protein [Salinisphaera sp. Q1T1-3]|uniref:D-alanyl-D-alanine carboxypeptidase family protein n=1 Tax=Salinisphaera sp. Q1T1-3 TaxID=2321229 RepID=UPI000E7632C2|nr:D-alanyl-D-alanine carboxypeptidase family protein [Salinisphaera sp. Q1T1-3]RJS94640.1 D-alanyl-D-alanine carboxypeptidase [Salinisphaera sp. Q1T1-3]